MIIKFGGDRRIIRDWELKLGCITQNQVITLGIIGNYRADINT